MIRRAAIQPSTLHTRHIRHDLQLGIQTAAAVAAEPVFVDLARVALGVVGFGGALGHFEGLARHDYVGGVGCAGPFLAVGAVAEGGGFGLAYGGLVQGGWSGREEKRRV